ncbi:MAG: hypothetical protein WBI63_00570 [Coriobacteriia bacterium]
MSKQGFGFARAFRTGLVAGAVFVVLAGAALGAYVLTSGHLPGQGRTDNGRVLVVAALPDENGDIVAQVIADVDASGTAATVTSVDTSLAVTVPGTTYDRIRDAYAFGGGGGVASAYARLVGGDPLPYIDLGPAALRLAIEEAGGIALDLPAPMNVFDGERLYTFGAGPVTADTDGFRAILNGAAYLPARERSALLEQAAARVTALLSTYPGGISAAIKGGSVASDLDPTAGGEFADRLDRL